MFLEASFVEFYGLPDLAARSPKMANLGVVWRFGCKKWLLKVVIKVSIVEGLHCIFFFGLGQYAKVEGLHCIFFFGLGQYAKMEEGGGLVNVYKDKVETFFIVFIQAQQFCNLIPTLSPCPNENMNGEGGSLGMRLPRPNIHEV